MKNSILDNKIIMALFIISCFALGWNFQSILSKKFSQSSKQITTIVYLEDKDMIKYESNLGLIADKKCNGDWKQFSYSSRDYSVNIICEDKTEFDLDFKTVMSYIENTKE